MITVKNNRFDARQFEKLKGGNNGFYCLMDDDTMLAAACIQKNRLGLNDPYINEIQTFKKGAGKRIFVMVGNYRITKHY